MKYLGLVFLGCLLVVVTVCRRSVTTPSQDNIISAVAEPAPRTIIVHDTVVVVKQQIKYVDKSDYKKSTDKELLKASSASASSVLVDVELSKSLSDTVRPQRVDSIIHYHDHWTDIRYNTIDSTCNYIMRDSISLYITQRRKHRFLFIRWGKKCYDVIIANRNPHSSISYLSTVAVK